MQFSHAKHALDWRIVSRDQNERTQRHCLDVPFAAHHHSQRSSGLCFVSFFRASQQNHPPTRFQPPPAGSPPPPPPPPPPSVAQKHCGKTAAPAWARLDVRL